MTLKCDSFVQRLRSQICLSCQFYFMIIDKMNVKWSENIFFIDKIAVNGKSQVFFFSPRTIVLSKLFRLFLRQLLMVLADQFVKKVSSFLTTLLYFKFTRSLTWMQSDIFLSVVCLRFDSLSQMQASAGRLVPNVYVTSYLNCVIKYPGCTNRKLITTFALHSPQC